MYFTVIVFVICLSFNLGNSYLKQNYIQHQKSIERAQRINHERSRKEGFDKFKMRRRETIVATPAFEMNVLESSNRILQPVEQTKVQADGDNLRYDIDNDDDKKDIQDENDSTSATMKTHDEYKGIARRGKRYNTDGELVAYNSKEAVMKVVLKQNDLIAELVALYQEEINRKEFREILDSVKKRNYDKCLAERQVNDKRSADKKDKDGKDKDDHANKQKIHTSKVNNKDVKNITGKITRENKDIEKNKTKDKDTSADEDINKKQNEDSKKDEARDKGKPLNKEKDDDAKKLSYIALDEEEVKKKLVESPFVRRILSRVEKKKQQYISRRKQEKELQKKGWQ